MDYYDKEYDYLRREIDENKKYVLERPFLTIGLGAAAAGSLKENFVHIIPPLIIFLLSFNLWFTINRLTSSARIVAYIQVFIEEGKTYIGWKNFLRKYRAFIKSQDARTFKQLIRKQLNAKGAPDSFRFYNVIWWFHAVSICTCLFISIYLYVKLDHRFEAFITMLASGAGFLFALIITLRNWFPKMKYSIEIERTIIELLNQSLDKDIPSGTK